MEVTTKKQNRRKIVIGVLIAVVVLVAAVIAFASSYLVNYAIGRSGDGGDREDASWRWKPPRMAWTVDCRKPRRTEAGQ